MVVDSNGEDDEIVDDVDDSWRDNNDNVWVVPRLSYAPTREDGSRHLTFVNIVNSSSIDFRTCEVAIKPKKRTTRNIAPDNNAPQRRDAVATAVRFASGLIQSNIVVIRGGTEDAPEYAKARNHVLQPRPVGWARRPQHGDTLGATYILRYEREITEIFNAGVIKSAEKRGPAQMREELRRRHPGLFSIPSVTKITQKVSALFQVSKDNGDTVIEVPTENCMVRKRRRGRPSVIPDDVAEFLRAAVEREPNIKPAHLLRVARDRFPDIAEAVTDNKIKSKIGSIKTSRKLAALRL